MGSNISFSYKFDCKDDQRYEIEFMDKPIDIIAEYENLNSDSNKKIFTQFEDKVQINIYNDSINN